MTVNLYTIDCPKCKVLEKKLQKAGVEYKTIRDVDILRQKGFEILPQLEVDGQVLDFKQAVDWINERSSG
jgi:glutaredoxin